MPYFFGVYETYASLALALTFPGDVLPFLKPIAFLPCSTVRHFQSGVNRSGLFSSWFFTYYIRVTISLIAVDVGIQNQPCQG